ncbi:hypothetical protein P9D34_07485 [Bacillus swezeyi]|nr:hypothetical protein [Bacillus swezeyi]MEC1260293.1 hypothetical protein [Bacillus swezeyi]MED2929900.1 hypothetical protein [Bacillus swezeyi]MED2942827.1 hypothetical protein [Bacillus swezeyi]MED2964686.1 hypothetical protein [Bacillus swezeyi]MED2976499.1 hypothetical protein [Bacillus swezeyi]
MKKLNLILDIISLVLLVGPYVVLYVLEHGNPIMNAWIRTEAEHL